MFPNPYVGEWELIGVSDYGAAVEAPLGSVLVLEDDFDLRIESGNACSGDYSWQLAETLPGPSVFTVDIETRTEVATSSEIDLALFLDRYHGDGGPSPYWGPFTFAASRIVNPPTGETWLELVSDDGALMFLQVGEPASTRP